MSALFPIATSALASVASSPIAADIPFIGDLGSSPLYLGSAVMGGAILTLQSVLLLFGGGDSDGEVDHGDSSDGFGFLSIRTVASFLTFFGLMGLYGTSSGWGTGATAGAATLAGLAMMLFVAWLFSLQRNLAQEGTIDPSLAIGLPAKVYLRVPGKRSGQGKVTVAIQGRTVEFAAVTGGADLPTGTDARIVRQIDENTFEIEAAP
jgi:hypothetical protein